MIKALTKFLSSKKSKIYILSIVIFSLAFSLRIWNLGDMGQVWDENSLLRDYAWYHINDARNFNFGSENWWKLTPDHPPLVRYMRGIASIPDIIAWDKNNWPIYSYELFHNRMLSVFLTSFAAVIVFLIGSRYISLYTGFVAGMIFSMLPVPLGHSQLAMLEPLALFFFPLSMYTFFLFLENPNKKQQTFAGIALGFAILARETHLMLLPMMLITIFIKHRCQTIDNLFSIVYRTIGIFGIAFITFFCLWPMPFFHLDYMIRYFMELRLSTTTSIPEVFFGKLILVPIPYYLIYFVITTPLVILILLGIGLKKIDRSNNWVWYALVLWLSFPFIMSFYPNRQQGIRYIIQISIPLSLIAAYGFETLVGRFFRKPAYKLLLLVPLFIYQFIILWRITPYYIDYFNAIAGGAKNVYEKRLFHLSWWGEGLKEAVDYINQHAPDGSTIGIATSPYHILQKMPGKIVSKYADNHTYDYVIVNFYNITREKFDDSKIRQNYEVMYSVVADGAHLVEVYKKK